MFRRSLLTTLAATLPAGCLGGSESTTATATGTATVGELPCPPSGVDADAAVCAHSVDESPVVVRTTDRSAPITDLRFVLTNGTGETLEFNPHNPDVYRYVGAGTREYDLVERRSSGSGVTTVPPAETYEWALADLPQADRLDPGAYLFAVRIPTEGAMEAAWVTCLAPFRLTDA